MIVVDTSVAVKWTLAEVGHADAFALLDLEYQRTAPDLLLPEFAHVMRKKTIRGEASWEQSRAALAKVEQVIDRFVPSIEISSAAFGLSETLNHSAYDCYFLAAALGRGILVTADNVFATKCSAAGYDQFVFAIGDPAAKLLAKIAALDLPSGIVLDELKRLANAVEATISSLYVAERGANPEKSFVPASAIAPAFGSPAYLRLRERLAALTQEQLSAVLATAWLGRTHHEPQDWPSLYANAKLTARGGFEAEASYILSQMNDLAAGVEKLRRFAGS